MKVNFRILAGMAALALLAGCGAGGSAAEEAFQRISPEEAARRMKEETDYILLDVRTQEEYDDGHIPGAVCLPSDMIEEGMPFSFDKDAEMLLYCHSDKRSAEAASKLRAMGYTNVSDIGCILDWPYETTTD